MRTPKACESLHSLDVFNSPLPSPPKRVSYLMAFPWWTPDVVGGSGCLIHVREKLGVRILYLANFLGAWWLATQMRASGEIVCVWVFPLQSGTCTPSFCESPGPKP